jgi:antitoxin ParD1/3/4
MSRNTSVSLSDHLAEFIESQVETGRYGSASEVVRAALRLLEDQETRLAALRDALVAGEASGPSEPFDFDDFIAARRDSASSRG